MRIWREASFNRFITCEGKLGKCDTMCDRVSEPIVVRVDRATRLDSRASAQEERLCGREPAYLRGRMVAPPTSYDVALARWEGREFVCML